MGMIRRGLAALLALFLAVLSVEAHDTWVQTNTALIRTGDVVHIDLMLGNHGNEHRDFKLAGKIDLAGSSLVVRAPGGKQYDVTDRLVDVGYAPKEGFWSTRFAAVEQGVYIVEHQVDKVVNHGQPVRSLKSAKTLFQVAPALDRVADNVKGFNQVCGHALELVPMNNPVVPMGPGLELKVQLLLKGKPLANTKVSFVPRGHTLAMGDDPEFERLTDENGKASFIPKEGNYYLVVAHHKSPEESGKDYEATQYSATLTVLVPEICPCCE